MSARRRIRPISDLSRLPSDCPELQALVEQPSWQRAARDRWGCCGMAWYAPVADETPPPPAAFWVLSPGLVVPEGPQSPRGSDIAVGLLLHISPGYAAEPAARQLTQSVTALMAATGITAIEMRASRMQSTCALPSADLLLSCGFEIIAPHPVHPRLRLEVSSTRSWRTGLRSRLDWLSAALRPLPGEAAGRSRPVVSPDCRVRTPGSAELPVHVR